jgi:DNA-directed RNA polymerase specialized sigma24 family protein
MLRLSVEGFQGQAWQEVARALAEYGHTVMFAWILTGRVFLKCRERGHGGPLMAAPVGRIPATEVGELAEDTVAEAIIHFRDRILKTAYWDPAKGASLTTFFVGNCLMQFPNVYRKWRRSWTHRLQAHSLDPLAHQASEANPEAEVLGGLRLRDLLSSLEERSRDVALLRSQGFSVGEIATLTGQSYKAVEGRLSRIRVTLKRLAS